MEMQAGVWTMRVQLMIDRLDIVIIDRQTSVYYAPSQFVDFFFVFDFNATLPISFLFQACTCTWVLLVQFSIFLTSVSSTCSRLFFTAVALQIYNDNILDFCSFTNFARSEKFMLFFFLPAWLTTGKTEVNRLF